LRYKQDVDGIEPGLPGLDIMKNRRKSGKPHLR
jgi:hypothetical protein